MADLELGLVPAARLQIARRHRPALGALPARSRRSRAVPGQDREDFGELGRSPGARRQDPRAKPLALVGLLIDALVVDRGRTNGTVPEPPVSLRSRARPLRTSRLPSWPTSSMNDDTCPEGYSAFLLTRIHNFSV